jgi:hypothetical protein
MQTPRGRGCIGLTHSLSQHSMGTPIGLPSGHELFSRLTRGPRNPIWYNFSKLVASFCYLQQCFFRQKLQITIALFT